MNVKWFLVKSLEYEVNILEVFPTDGKEKQKEGCPFKFFEKFLEVSQIFLCYFLTFLTFFQNFHTTSSKFLQE